MLVDSGSVEGGLEEANLEPRRWRQEVSMARVRDGRPGSRRAARVPSPQHVRKTHQEKPVHIWVRWLLWKHQIFPFSLSRVRMEQTDNYLGLCRHEGGPVLP